MSFAAVLVSGALAQDCPEPVSATDLVRSLERAEQAFAAVDVPTFLAETDTLRGQLPCTRERIPRNVIASLQRTEGLRNFIDRTGSRSEQAFAAARAIEPDYAFPDTLVPADHPILGSYDAIPVESGYYLSVPAPAEGYLHFDGRPGASRPLAWPAIIQVYGARGEVLTTTYVWPEEALPSYPVEPLVADTPADPIELVPTELPTELSTGLPTEPIETSRTDRRLLAVAGGAAVGAVALYTLAGVSNARYYGDDAEFDDLEMLRKRTNRLVYGASASAAVAMGAGAVLVVRW